MRLKALPIVIETDELRRLGFQSLDRLVAACEYRRSPLVRKALHALKYKRSVALIPYLVMLMEEARSVCVFDGQTALTAVPMYWMRRFSRGFNQAEKLGRSVGERCNIPFVSLLRKVRSTGSQVGRGRGERVKAVHNAFKVRKGVEVPLHVIIVDDICTTGGTLDACAAALKKAGVRRVEGLVVARD